MITARRHIAAASTVVATLIAGGIAKAEDLVYAPRQPLVMLVTVPKGAELKTQTSELLSAAREALAEHTDLEAVPPSSEEDLNRCKKEVRLGCWTQEVRAAGGARYFLAISVQPYSDDREQLSALLIDTEEAMRAINADKEASPEALEDAIYARAARAKLGFARTSDPRSLREYFRELFEGFRPGFEASGHWDPYGVLEVIRAEPGTLIELDGHAVGALAAVPARVRGVPGGAHAVELVSPSGRRSSHAITLPRAGVATIADDLAPTADEERLPRRLALYSSLAVAAAGAALTVVAIAAPKGSTYLQTCVDASCGSEAPLEFASLCDLTAGDASCLGSRGLPLAPLGYSLLAAGGIAAIGTLLDDDETRFPWIPIAIGLGAGALSFGLSVALEPDSTIR